MKLKATNVFQRNWDAFNRDDIVYIKNEGGSRCHAPGTLIRMYDGSLKKVEDIKLGDKVASYDGLSYNTVIDLHNGVDDMYLIKQGKGDDYIVNKNHLLSVRQTRNKPYKKKEDGVRKEFYDAPYDRDLIHHFSAEEWSKMSLRTRRNYSGFKNTFLKLRKINLEIDPYYLGLWLGDGSSSRPTEITTNDKEIIDYLYDFKEDKTFLEKKGDYSYNIRSDVFNRQTELSKLFYKEELVRNKHIPKKYIYSSYNQRLRLIAGLIDSDGHQTKRNTLVFSNINKKLIDDVYELIIISGFYTNGIKEYIAKMKREDGSIYKVKAYYIQFNSLDFSELNKYIKLERKKVIRKTENLHMFNTKIESIYIGKGEYYGFTLDKCPLYKLKDGTITHNSSKTYSITQLLIIWALKNPNKIISVIRKHTTTVKNTIMKQDFIPMLKDMGLYKKDSFNMTDASYTFDNGTVIEFYGADDDQKLHGRRRDIAWLNEATELTWDDFKQIAMRTTGKIIIDYNPSAPMSFLYELPEDKTVQIHSTYHDNPFLTKTQMDFIEDLKRTDPTGYQIYALGKRGIAKENVYSLWERSKERPKHLKNFIYGIDFGFSHDTAMVKIWYDTDTMKVFIEEMIYAPKLTSGDIVEEMNRLSIDKDISIMADYARPEIIHDMRLAGYTVIEADKSVKAGINSVRQFDICICENSLNIKRENELYKYKKVGEVITEDPIKKYDDAMDAIRYALHYVKTYECGDGSIEVWTFDLS